MCRQSTAVTVQCGDTLKKLASLGSTSPLFVDTKRVATDILQQLLQVYGNNVMKSQQSAKRCCTFSSGRDNVMVTIEVDDKVP
jgi:hypothetical protein